MNYRILNADFQRSVKQYAALPAPSLPEAAFIGRSNCGKSSLINALCGSRLAKTGGTPGRTQALNFFQVRLALAGEQGEDRFEAFFVDLPGYGYAKVPKSEKQNWPELIAPYLFKRESLAAAVLLIDCRRSVAEEEEWFLPLSENGRLLVALTKADKLSRGELKQRQADCAARLKLPAGRVIITSTLSGKRRGLEELLDAIALRLFAGG